MDQTPGPPGHVRFSYHLDLCVYTEQFIPAGLDEFLTDSGCGTTMSSLLESTVHLWRCYALLRNSVIGTLDLEENSRLDDIVEAINQLKSKGAT